MTRKAKTPPKRYELRIQDKVLLRTDEFAAVNAKIQELKADNVDWFRFTDNETGNHTVYAKESYQKNYVKTVIPGTLPKA